jgi:hypothetical protein
MIYIVWFYSGSFKNHNHTSEKLGSFNTLKEAQTAIENHPKYKKTLFTKRGNASSNNPNKDDYYRIYDSEEFGRYWSIRKS